MTRDYSYCHFQLFISRTGLFFEPSVLRGQIAITAQPPEASLLHSTLSFTLDLVLLESHPLYEKPTADEQYCYRNARIHFFQTQHVHWHARSALVSTDADGKADLGNVDTFMKDGPTYHLTGDWGAVSITCGCLQVDFQTHIAQQYHCTK